MGLAYKADSDDLRNSPALKITEDLIKQGYDVSAVEPNIKNHESLNLVPLSLATQKADIIVILVKHSEFLNFDKHSLLYESVVLDFCNCLEERKR